MTLVQAQESPIAPSRQQIEVTGSHHLQFGIKAKLFIAFFSLAALTGASQRGCLVRFPRYPSRGRTPVAFSYSLEALRQHHSEGASNACWLSALGMITFSNFGSGICERRRVTCSFWP
jgi:hypothetical protein